MSNWRLGKSSAAALIIQLAALMAILLDVPFLRQVIGFVYLTFLPGFLVLKILRLGKISVIENVLFSAGISVAILMFVGLLSNEIYPILGILKPLSTSPLVATIFASTLIFYVASFRKAKNPSEPAQTTMEFKFSRVVPLLVCIPILTILGTEILLISGSNFILLTIAIIVSSIVLCTCSKRLVPPETYTLVVLVISIFLLFHVSLISKYIIGTDVHLEYYFANLTSNNSIWGSSIPHEYNAMLSVTILPVQFSKFLNLDLDWVFKAVYPLIFSLVPLSLFVIYHKLTSSRIAFLSAFFFISMDVFYGEMLGLTRQMIAELFLVLLILLIVEDKIGLAKRRLLFVIFSAALIVSHYATSYIFMFYLLFAFCLTPIWKRLDAQAPSEKTSLGILQSVRVRAGALVTGSLVLVYSAIAVGWYVIVDPAPFNALVFTLDHIYNSILAHASAPGVSGLMPRYVSPLHQVSQYLFYGLMLLIAVGIVGSIVRYKETTFNRQYFSMSMVSMLILIVCMVVPSFASGLNISRFYHITSFFLAPFVVLGILTISDLIVKVGSWPPTRIVKHGHTNNAKSKGVGLFLVSLLLVLFFLFQVGFIYEIAGDTPSSLSLSYKRLLANPLLALDIWLAQTPEPDVFSAKWLSKYIDNQSKVYADRTSSLNVLTSYGMMPTVYFSANSRLGTYDYLLSPTGVTPAKDGFIYLRALNVIYGKMNGPLKGRSWNVTEISPFLNSCDKIYTDGDSEIYKNPL